MNSNFTSKHGEVSISPADMFMRFTDMRNFTQQLPPQVAQMNVDLTADFDHLSAVVQGMNIAVKVKERVPYSKIVIEDDGAPIDFELILHFDPAASDPWKTDFWIEVAAELNMMMKMMLKGKIQEGLDKLIDGLTSGQI